MRNTMSGDATLSRLISALDLVADEVKARGGAELDLVTPIRGYRGPEFVWEWALRSEVPRGDVTVSLRPSYFPSPEEPPR
jgi:hypothetical protein